MFCGKCGSRQNEGMIFCNLCGTQLSGSVNNTPIYVNPVAYQPVVPKKKMTNSAFAITVIAANVIVAVVIGLSFGNRSSAQSTSAVPICRTNRCENRVQGSYSRCSQHVYICRGCRKEIGSLDYGWCNACRR